MIASKTNDWSGRDLVERLLKTAIHSAILDNKDVIKIDDLEKILKNVKKEQSYNHYI
jgi:AAA family ATPase